MNCRNIRPMIARVDGGSIQCVGGVHLGHGPFEDGESSEVETFEEHSAGAFVGSRVDWGDG